jgi:exopolysaccharide transport family protein
MNRPFDLMPASGPSTSTESMFDESEIRWLLGCARRRRWWIILPTLLLTAVVIFTVYSISPRFMSSVTLVLEPQEQKLLEIEEVLASDFLDSESLYTEVEVMRSRRIAKRVIDQLGLMDDPEFNASLREDSVLGGALKNSVAKTNNFLNSTFGISLSGGDRQSNAVIERENVISNFSDNLTVRLRPDTRVLVVEVSAGTAEKAALIADTVAETYITDMLDSSYEATLKANQWLAGKVAELQGDVAGAEQAVERFRREASLLQGQQGTLLAEQVSSVNAQLLIATGGRAESEARYNQIRRLVQSRGSAETAPDVLGSPIVQGLIAQEAVVKRRVAELSEELGPKHPARVSAQSELSDVQRNIRNEINKIVSALANDVEVARAREASLRAELNSLKAQMANANTSEVQLRSLERNAEAQRMLLQNFLTRAQETTAQLDEGFQRPAARVIAEANIPQFPYYPPKKLIVVAALVGGLIFFFGLAALLEMLHRGLRSTDEVEETIQIPAAGMVPRHRRSFTSRRSLFRVLSDNPNGVLAESLQSCLANLLLPKDGTPPKTILVTSSVADEGKSTLALGMARVAAAGGQRTLIIEADLRRPTFNKSIELPEMPGLNDYFSGEKSFESVIYKDPEIPLHIAAASSPNSQPGTSIRSPEFSALLEKAREEYDLVLIDSPPVLAVADSRLIAQKVDGVVVAIRWSTTRRDRVKLTVKQLSRAGGKILGGIITMVDTRKHAAYDFADSAYYASYTQRRYFSKG